MVSLKLVYTDDIRKITLDCLSIASLHEKIQSLYADLENVSFENLYLYYIDEDNDKVRVKFDFELVEALRYIQEKNGLLKLFIQKTGTSQATFAPASVPDVANLAPFLGMLNSIAPMMLNNPATMQQMAFMLPSMLPLLNSILAPPVNTGNAPLNKSTTSLDSLDPVSPQPDTTLPPPSLSSSYLPPPSSLSSSYAAPTQPHIDWHNFVNNLDKFCDSGVNAAPVYASVSTNTLIDAKDAATETMYGVAQTTQTQPQYSNTHQTTQTHQSASSATQTSQESSTTQTTQTHQNDSCGTQTLHAPVATQVTQSTQSAQVQSDIEVPCVTAPQVNFYESLSGTQFGSLLAQLSELGFTDKQKCVQALVKNGGKLPEAIDELLLDQLLA